MSFRDEVQIEVEAGRGGDGLVSFRHEKYVPMGGPDGGDGGKGGDIVLVTSPHVRSLLALGRQPTYRSRKGQPGGPRCKTGRSGEDLMLEVPAGTMVYDAARGNLLRDLNEEGQTLVIAQGGSGGRGNTSFANSVNQAPRQATQGKSGEAYRLRLELKLFAEVGLIGLPNAGKSTFLSAVTAATPKVADYPFTTLEPQVGIAQVGDFDTLVLADLPGLVEGASEGRGLGHRFLKHVERCRVLLHLVDVSSDADVFPEEAFEVIDRELMNSSPELHARPRVFAATKVEDDFAREQAADWAEKMKAPVHCISSQTGAGVQELLLELQRIVRAAD